MLRNNIVAVALGTTLVLTLAARAPAADEEPVAPAVQGAVDKGLEWLAKNQDRSSGMWATPDANGASVAITSLAVMAFMARGHTPGQGPYGENINKAIDYVLRSQLPNGVLCSRDMSNHTMYEHGIATVMLCEACGMLDDKRQEQTRAAIAKAVRVILTAQRVPKSAGNAGGWRYEPTANDSDISVTGWQLMALRGAANAGADIPAASIQAGIAYIKRRANSDGGFSYTGNDEGGSNPARTGTGVLALELLGQHGAKQSLGGGDYLLAHPPGSAAMENYFYSVYYCSQAAYQLGGKYWELLGPTIRDSLIHRQQRDGSWTLDSGQTVERAGGTAYATSMALLALAVPYRYLPIYQR